MSGVQHYRRKPEPGSHDDQVVARYEPGRPLDDLAAVARRADGNAELGEIAFPSGPVLVVRWKRIPDDHPPEIEYETIEPGRYLAYSPGSDFLYDTSEADLRRWYDQVEG
jgi:hypothetical protein